MNARTDLNTCICNFEREPFYIIPKNCEGGSSSGSVIPVSVVASYQFHECMQFTGMHETGTQTIIAACCCVKATQKSSGEAGDVHLCFIKHILHEYSQKQRVRQYVL